jgi:hypothetical protein
MSRKRRRPSLPLSSDLRSVAVERLPAFVDRKGVIVGLAGVDEREIAFVPVFSILVVELAELEVFATARVVPFVLLALGAKEDVIGATVVQRTETHRARMGHYVDVTPREVLTADPLAGLFDRNGLSVGDRVVRLGDEIWALG